MAMAVTVRTLGTVAPARLLAVSSVGGSSQWRVCAVSVGGTPGGSLSWQLSSSRPTSVHGIGFGRCGFGSCGLGSSSSEAAEPVWLANAAAAELAEVGGGGGDDKGGDDGGAGRGWGGDGADEGGDGGKNKAEALLALATLGRTLESLPSDLAHAIGEGRIPGAIVQRFAELEKSPFLRWLLRFGGFKERLLADELFMTKVAIECGVGIFTKTAAELERRRENFGKELDFVVADVIMALIADFMLVWLPAPTVSLRPALARDAGRIAKFFYNCPDNAFQVALRGTSYSLLQRGGAIVRNGAKLLAVGTTASLVGTASTNALIALRRNLDKNKNFDGESEDVPIVATSLAYGVYMAISSNLRYQILAGVIEQRLLEPWLHNQKLALSVLSFGVRTGNTFLGSLMWVDYARFIGVQKVKE